MDVCFEANWAPTLTVRSWPVSDEGSDLRLQTATPQRCARAIFGVQVAACGEDAVFFWTTPAPSYCSSS